MVFIESKFQIGKHGITQGVINSLNLSLKTRKQIRISVLKSASRNRSQIKNMAEEIISKVNCKCDYKIIGFTIILRKLSKGKK